MQHLPELQEYMGELKAQNKISTNTTFHRYIDYMQFEPPEELPQAKSIIILAIASKLGTVDIHYKSTIKKAYVPQNYYDMGPDPGEIIKMIQKNIIQLPGFHCVRTKLHLKLLAVRSGLAKYGRNNITYVDGMGSFYNLFAFYTDFEFEQDDWHDMELLKYCNTCTICLNKCPTGAIREGEMVIDVEKCISLYNEIPGEIPSWIDAKAHNSLMGCMKCQAQCPGNKEAIQNLHIFDAISEKSVNLILNEDDKKEFQAVFGPIFDINDQKSTDYFFPVFRRNLEVFLS